MKKIIISIFLPLLSFGQDPQYQSNVKNIDSILNKKHTSHFVFDNRLSRIQYTKNFDSLYMYKHTVGNTTLDFIAVNQFADSLYGGYIGVEVIARYSVRVVDGERVVGIVIRDPYKNGQPLLFTVADQIVFDKHLTFFKRLKWILGIDRSSFLVENYAITKDKLVTSYLKNGLISRADIEQVSGDIDVANEFLKIIDDDYAEALALAVKSLSK